MFCIQASSSSQLGFRFSKTAIDRKVHYSHFLRRHVGTQMDKAEEIREWLKLNGTDLAFPAT